MNTHHQAIKVSKELFSVLNLFDLWRLRTNGALDPAAEIVNKIWKEAAAKSALPSQDAMNNAIAEVKQVHWILDAKNQTATKNGINILWTRIPGSQRPTVKGMTKYVMYDVGGGIYDTNFEVSISFNNSLL